MVTISRLTRASPHHRRAKIIEVATQIFMEDGFAATTMSMVAESLGGSKATLYKYFPSKEDLFEAVIAQACAVILEPLRDPAIQNDNLADTLRSYAGRYLRVIFAPLAMRLHRLVHAEAERFPQLARMFFATGPDPSNLPLAHFLQDLAAKGQIFCPAPLMTAQQFLGMVRGDFHMRVVCCATPMPNEAEIDAWIDNAVMIFVLGIGQMQEPTNFHEH